MRVAMMGRVGFIGSHVSEQLVASRLPAASFDDAVFEVAENVIPSINLFSACECVVGRALEVVSMKAQGAGVPRNVLDVSLAKDELGWKAEIAIEDGIARMWHQLRERP